MADASSTPSRKRRVNITLDEALVAEAKEMGLNLSEVAGAALSIKLAELRQAAWQEKYRSQLEAKAKFIEKHGTLAEQLGLI